MKSLEIWASKGFASATAKVTRFQCTQVFEVPHSKQMPRSHVQKVLERLAAQILGAPNISGWLKDRPGTATGTVCPGTGSGTGTAGIV